MYHRFNESKYPSTNIQLEIFKEQLKIIENETIQFVDPKMQKTQENHLELCGGSAVASPQVEQQLPS